MRTHFPGVHNTIERLHCIVTLSYSIILFIRLVSPSSCLALAQSGLVLNRMHMLSITVATSSGGLLNTRISAMSLLSKESRA